MDGILISRFPFHAVSILGNNFQLFLARVDIYNIIILDGFIKKTNSRRHDEKLSVSIQCLFWKMCKKALI